MLRILGYNKSETAKLYMMSTTIAAVISVLLSLGIAAVVMRVLYDYFMQELAGWLTYYVDPDKLCVGSCTGTGIIRCFSGVTVSQNRKSRLRSSTQGDRFIKRHCSA